MRHDHCKKCGRVFQSTLGQKVCPTCRDRHERAYRAAKEVLLADPNASFADIVRETGFDLELIQELSREELIHVINAAGGNLSCDRCGKEILSGHMCETCEYEVRGMLNDLSNGIKQRGPEPAEPQRSRSGFHTREK